MTNETDYRNIPGCPGYSICVSTLQVRHDASGRILRPCWGKAGSRCYWQHTISGKTHRVHRLLVSALLGRDLDRSELICHRDNNPANNSRDNLRLGCAASNAADRLGNNTYGRKLRNQDVRDLRMLVGRKSVKAIADRYGISTSHVYRIISGRAWAGLV